MAPPDPSRPAVTPCPLKGAPFPPLAWTIPSMCSVAEVGDLKAHAGHELECASVAQLGIELALKQSPPLASAANIHRGRVTNQAVAETFGLKYESL